MKKWLVGFVVILVALGGVAFWLAGQAQSAKPETGEVRMEIENVF